MEGTWCQRYTHRQDNRTTNEQLKRANQQNNYLRIMILGNSMVRWLPLMGAMSLAFLGCTIEWLTQYYQTHRYVLNWHCDAIVIMIGTNNVNRSDFQFQFQFIYFNIILNKNNTNIHLAQPDTTNSVFG